MKTAPRFSIHPGWQLLLRDAGLQASNVLRRADLPEDLFARPSASLTTAEYFRLWQALDDEAKDPTFPIRLGSAISVESFDAPLFASLCSPNLDIALRRLSHYKPLLGPMALHLESTTTGTKLEVEWLDKTEVVPNIFVAIELVFFVQLARLATREHICPIALAAPHPLEPADAYTEYFGCPVEIGPRCSVTFSPNDATRPFLTANEAMWQFFQPELRKRLATLDADANFADRVRGALLELLPSGSSSLTAVAKKLAVSQRTLQRRLHTEGMSYRQVLDTTREELARHYLASSSMSSAEISFLLGFEEPTSFFRAFHAWTGETPEQARLAVAGGATQN